MIIFTELLAWCTGIIMIGAASFVGHFTDLPYVEADTDEAQEARAIGRGYGGLFAICGFILSGLAWFMVLVNPLHVNPPINLAFGIPCVAIGAVALGAGLWLWLGMKGMVLNPLLWLLAAVGAIAFVYGLAILRFDLVGDAPPQEPITGQLQGWENTAFGLVYILSALGCLLAPWIFRSHRIQMMARGAWYTAGALWLLFGLLNMYTHIGYLINIIRGTNYTW